MKFLIYLMLFVLVLAAGGFLFIAMSDIRPVQTEISKEIKPEA